MRSSTWKPYLWQVVGLLFYLVGMVIFLVVMIDVFTASAENPIESLSSEHLLPMALSILLLVIGRLISWRFGTDFDVGTYGMGIPGYGGHQPGRDDHPDQTVLEKYGYYRRPAESDGNTDRELDDVVDFDRDPDGVYCEECGTVNDADYDYCGNCATELRK